LYAVVFIGDIFGLATADMIHGACVHWLIESESSMLQRAMFRTSSHHLGLGPSTAETGDKIFLLSGSKVPLVLRQYGARWRVVGEAYVHGIMYGEAYDESKDGPIWLE
jgi:hypothetical protein